MPQLLRLCVVMADTMNVLGYQAYVVLGGTQAVKESEGYGTQSASIPHHRLSLAVEMGPLEC